MARRYERSGAHEFRGGWKGDVPLDRYASDIWLATTLPEGLQAIQCNSLQCIESLVTAIDQNVVNAAVAVAVLGQNKRVSVSGQGCSVWALSAKAARDVSISSR